MPESLFTEQIMEKKRQLVLKDQGGLSVDHAKKILFLSFRISQGAYDIQRNMFRYFALNNPKWRINEYWFYDVLNETVSSAENFLIPSNNYEMDPESFFHTPNDVSGRKIDRGTIYISGKKGLAIMQHEFEKPKRQKALTKTKLVQEISKRIIEKDYQFLCEQNGRPRTEDRQGSSPVTDPYLSFAVFYGLDGHTTGIAEYDEMFGDIGTFLKLTAPEQIDLLTDGKFSQVVEKHVQHHPNKIDAEKIS